MSAGGYSHSVAKNGFAKAFGGKSHGPNESLSSAATNIRSKHKKILGARHNSKVGSYDENKFQIDFLYKD